MKLLTLLLVPAALFGGPFRFARLGEFQGQVEVQLTAADPWIPAERNLALGESAWLRTGPGARVEIELDDGGAWRIGAGSLAEISDYTVLSTGQRVTLLSLDQGTAYYTGQPRGKDVTMLTMPGAQSTVLQGSRIRLDAQPGGSQVAVLEGQVRFSSPAAELDLHEGTTARVEPGNRARFFLYPEVVAEPLDRWSEDRDKLEAAPVSSAYVTARYGLSDLDSAGKWLPTDGLGMVWRPDAQENWAPYQKGRWRYLDAVGYTWVSDDSWGWLPYHNGRWTNLENIGWVWQPGISIIFHPGEVYWTLGAKFAGWGPLAPGEQWNSAVARNTTYAGFQQDTRLLDGSGFAVPAAEQLKAAMPVPGLPSPAFLTARLDAVRPTLQVGRTRVMPSIPGVTFGDTPAPDLMTSPPDSPTVADADAGATPPPDGVYPVPVVMTPVIEVPVIINAPSHPDYAKPAPAGAKPGAGQTTASSSSTSGTAPTTPGGPPLHANPPEAPKRPVTPLPKPGPPPIDPPKTKPIAMTPGEQNLYRQVLKDIDPATPNFRKAIEDLNTWADNYPASASKNDRLYYYVHVYDATGSPDKVLETAAPLVEAGVRNSFHDEQQVLQVLVAAASSVGKLRAPTREQLGTAQSAAKELMDFLPDYFNARHKPANVSDSAWSLARGHLETIAKQALAHRPAARAAVN